MNFLIFSAPPPWFFTSKSFDAHVHQYNQTLLISQSTWEEVFSNSYFYVHVTPFNKLNDSGVLIRSSYDSFKHTHTHLHTLADRIGNQFSLGGQILSVAQFSSLYVLVFEYLRRGNSISIQEWLLCWCMLPPGGQIATLLWRTVMKLRDPNQ